MPKGLGVSGCSGLRILAGYLGAPCIAAIASCVVHVQPVTAQGRIRFDVASGADLVGDTWQNAPRGQYAHLGVSRAISNGSSNRIQVDLVALFRHASLADTTKGITGAGLRVSVEHAARHRWSVYEQGGVGIYGIAETRDYPAKNFSGPLAFNALPSLEGALGLRRAFGAATIGIEARATQLVGTVGTHRQFLSIATVVTFGGS